MIHLTRSRTFSHSPAADPSRDTDGKGTSSLPDRTPLGSSSYRTNAPKHASEKNASIHHDPSSTSKPRSLLKRPPLTQRSVTDISTSSSNTAATGYSSTSNVTTSDREDRTARRRANDGNLSRESEATASKTGHHPIRKIKEPLVPPPSLLTRDRGINAPKKTLRNNAGRDHSQTAPENSTDSREDIRPILIIDDNDEEDLPVGARQQKGIKKRRIEDDLRPIPFKYTGRGDHPVHDLDSSKCTLTYCSSHFRRITLHSSAPH